ncbi:hypothetical protein Dimus_025068 [Dionaea muscipula]
MRALGLATHCLRGAGRTLAWSWVAAGSLAGSGEPTCEAGREGLVAKSGLRMRLGPCGLMAVRWRCPGRAFIWPHEWRKLADRVGLVLGYAGGLAWHGWVIVQVVYSGQFAVDGRHASDLDLLLTITMADMRAIPPVLAETTPCASLYAIIPALAVVGGRIIYSRDASSQFPMLTTTDISVYGHAP